MLTHGTSHQHTAYAQNQQQRISNIGYYGFGAIATKVAAGAFKNNKA
jgi:hypothetical protein